jgi:hypothetical protein
MRALKITLIILGFVVVLIIIAFGIFVLRNRQKVVTPFAVNNPEASTRLLIASQGSDFKDALVDSLTEYFEGRQVYLRVVDVSGLAEIQEEEWDALLLIHTTQGWRLQPDVKKYLDRATELKKVVLLTTSGSGEWRADGYEVDIITSASKMSEMKSVRNEILQRLGAIMGLNEPEAGDTSSPAAE